MLVFDQQQHVFYSTIFLMDALKVYHSVDVLTLLIHFETQCPVEETNKEEEEENVIYATLFLLVILFCIMFLCCRIFTGSQ